MKLHIFIFISCCVWVVNTLSAQAQIIPVVQVAVWRDTVSTQRGGTFTNRLTFYNTGLRPANLFITSTLPQASRLVSTLPTRLLIQPGEHLMLPVKGVIDLQADSLHYPVIVTFSDSSGQARQAVNFTIQVKQAWQPAVTLYPYDEPILLYSGSETANLPLRLVHNRLTPSSLRIDVASMPEGINRTMFPLSLTLTGRQDTTISIPCLPGRYWSVNTPYQLTVTVRDASGSVMGNVVYRLVVASSVKRFTDFVPTSLSPYGVSTAVGQLSDRQWLREAQVWGSDSLGRNQLDFRLHYMNYGTGQTQQLQNSFVSLHNEHTMVRVGSLYDYHELSMLGRGLKVSLIQPDHQWTFWAVNSNPNWLNAQGNSWSGNIVSVRYDKQLNVLPGASWSASSNYFSQPYSQRLGFLNFGAFQFQREGRHSLEIMGAQSVEFARQGNRTTYGWAGQLNYTYRSSRLDWVVRTYFSNPVYSGFQKGATLIDNRLIYRPSPSTTLTLRYSQVSYNQHWFYTPVDWRRRLFGNSQAEIGVVQQWRKWSIGVRPYWYTQMDIANPYSSKVDLYRIAPHVLYRNRERQRLELTYDVGTYQNRTPTASQSVVVSQRLLGSLGLGPFSLWAYWQQGPYFLGDLRPEQSTKTTVASITPTIDYTLLQQRLYGTIGINYLYDSYSTGSRAQVLGRLRYDITSDVTVRAEGNMTAFSQLDQLAYSQYRVEMSKRFSTLSLRRRGQIKLSFFEDVNGNGLRETEEPWMDSLLVTINKNTLLTNQKGEIVYRNLSMGSYTVSAVLISRMGEPAPYNETIVVNGRVQKQIPMARTFRVLGKLTSRAHIYDRQPARIDRFALEVKQNERTVIRCTPLPDGTFGLPLGPGNYILLVYDLERQPVSVVQTVPFTLTPSGKYPALQLSVDATTQPVEIKRFTSTNK